MTVGAHHGAGMKIHMLRSMASTINTSHSESFLTLTLQDQQHRDGR
jgi:hypothetical protein